MKMSKEQYESHMHRVSGGARSKLQKLKKNSPIRKKARTYNRSSKEKEDAGDGKTVSVECVFRVSDKRKRDLDGMQSTVLDCLVDAGIIPDDNIYVVRKISAHWVRCEKGFEGVKVKILEGKIYEL